MLFYSLLRILTSIALAVAQRVRTKQEVGAFNNSTAQSLNTSPAYASVNTP
jgi:hypothetical protein